MNEARIQIVEGIQKLVAGLIATNSAGHRLCLIGGFRYRLLSRSCRTSLDIDYHWDGDMDGKQRELVELLRMKLLPEVRRRFGYEGTVGTDIGPAAVAERSAQLLKNRVVYTRAIDAIIDDQVDAAVAANLRASGGGAIIFDAVVNLLAGKLGIPKGIER